MKRVREERECEREEWNKEGRKGDNENVLRDCVKK